MRSGPSVLLLLARPLPYGSPMKGIFGQARQESASPPHVPATDVEKRTRRLWGSRPSLPVLAAWVVIVMLKFAAPLLLPVVLSLMLFYMLDPIVDALERW